MIFGFNLIRWLPISKYDDDSMYGDTVFLKCPVNGEYEGWLNDSGFEPYHQAEFSGPATPQPTHFRVLKRN